MWSVHSKGDPFSYALKAFSNIMEHGTVSWEILEADFIKQASYKCVHV